MLWAQGCISVVYRDGECEELPDYSPTATEDCLHPVTIAKVIACYLYQITELPDWQDTPAHAWCRRLSEAVESSLPASALPPVHDVDDSAVPAYQRGTVYERSPWTVSSNEEIPLADDRA